eukprot:scaffold28969_cov82-Skeletonema_dohrnii-CCMP3373.AAC.2
MASSTQPQQCQSHRLTEQANSHGPYLWSGADIENALLWFPCPTKQHAAKPSQQQNQVENNEKTAAAEEATTADLLEKDNQPSSNTSISSSAEQVDTNEGFEFLRLLLHSRGIWNPRPPKKKKRSITSSKSAYSSSDDKRKRKRNDNYSNNIGGNNSIRIDGSKRSSSNTTELSSSPLQSVLMGYYQLFHQKKVVVTPSDSSVKDRNNNSGDDDDKDNGTAAAAAATIQASSKLYNDLTTIISSRRHTHEIYQASLHATLSSSSQPPQDDQNNKFNMSIKIDQYMIHPTTCARRVYASSIYDRLFHLASTAKDKDDLTTTSKEVQNFLQKLLGLATAADDKGEKIQEVILLLILEPLRRLQIRQLRTKKKSEEKMEGQDCWNVPPQNRQREELMELFPLLTSQIVSSSAASATNNLLEETCAKKDESSSPLVTLLVKSILHTNLDTWWHQPSPLLCTISQYNFPIACKYLHYWVDRALVTHGSCYQDTSNDEEMEAFHHAVERIQEFHRTSHRLRGLLSHVIHNMGEEIRMSASGLIDEDVDESEVFKTTLALRAIQRALE